MNMPKYTIVAKTSRYEILDAPAGRAIRCLKCLDVSYHPQDIQNRHCNKCKVFHDVELSKDAERQADAVAEHKNDVAADIKRHLEGKKGR